MNSIPGTNSVKVNKLSRDFGQLVSYGTNTKVEKVRFQLLSEVENLLKAHELPVIVDPVGGLWTKNPNEENCNINFWPYTPQGDYDKAPMKVR